VLQDATGAKNLTGLAKVKSDFHVLLSGTTKDEYKASGYLFLENREDQSYILLKMEHSGDTMTFNREVESP